MCLLPFRSAAKLRKDTDALLVSYAGSRPEQGVHKVGCGCWRVGERRAGAGPALCIMFRLDDLLADFSSWDICHVQVDAQWGIDGSAINVGAWPGL